MSGQYNQLRIALAGRVYTLRTELDLLEKESAEFKYTEAQLKDCEHLLFDITGSKAPEFKKLINGHE